MGLDSSLGTSCWTSLWISCAGSPLPAGPAATSECRQPDPVSQHLLPQPCLISIPQRSLEANTAREVANLTHGRM